MSKFAILGAGMQGTAAAHDIAKYSSPDALFMGDENLEQATKSSDRINKLIGSKIATPVQVNALNPQSVKEFVERADVLLSCVPYWMHPQIAVTAIASKVNMVDMGGDTRVARKTLELNKKAVDQGVIVIPDTGLAPGLVNNLGSYMMEQFDCTTSIKLYCGGLPQIPKPPFNYKLVFNVEGLITEYMDRADVLRDGNLILVDTLEELETIQVDGLGTMEAFVTSGGASTAPETYLGRVSNYEYKTIRYPGHCEKMKIFKDFGFWSNDEIAVRSGTAIPREVFCALMNPRLKDPSSKDLVIVRAVAIGKKDGIESTKSVEILQKQDDVTGFTAMEQLTGASTAIYAAGVATGNIAPGCHRYETAMSGQKFVSELIRRGIKVKSID